MMEITGLAPGQYELQHGDPPRIDDLNLSASLQLASNAGAPAAGIHVAVQMNQPDSAPAQWGLIAFLDDVSHPQPYLKADCQQLECTFAAIPPGVWRLHASVREKAFAVVSTTIGGKTHTGNLLTVTDRTTEMTVTVHSATTRIDGFALKDGKGHPNILVLLVPDNPAVHGDLFRRDQADSDGSFSLRNAAPGAYTVVAIEDGWGLDWQIPAVIARYLEHGIAVTVPEGSPQQIRLSTAVPVQSKEEIPAGTLPGTSSKPGGEGSL